MPGDLSGGGGSPGEQGAPLHAPGHWQRRTAALFRWLHLYVSMASFGILFFFAVTGLTLNHADWFSGGKPRLRQVRGEMPAAWVKPPDNAVARLEVAEHLRRAHGVHGTVSEFRLEPDQCTVSFHGPGYSADATVDRASGRYELVESRLGFMAVINDLHKGRDTGSGWSWVIDVSAALLAVVSLTGAVLLLFVKRRRWAGLVTAFAGAALCYGLYLLLVR